MLQVSLFYIVATVVVGAIQYLVDLEPNIAVGIGILLASAVMPVRNFVLDHHRPFKRREQLRFALLAFVSVLIVSIAFIALTAWFVGGLKDIWSFMNELNATPQELALAIAMMLLFSGLVAFAVLYFAAGSRLECSRDFTARGLLKRARSDADKLDSDLVVLEPPEGFLLTALCPLSRVKRTSATHASMSASDPKRTLPFQNNIRFYPRKN